MHTSYTARQRTGRRRLTHPPALPHPPCPTPAPRKTCPQAATACLTHPRVWPHAAALLARRAAGPAAPPPAWLHRAGAPAALATTLAAAVACIAADAALDAWGEVAGAPAAACAHLPLPVRLAGVAHGLLIRCASEAGRLGGHVARGRLLRNLCARFNWFGDMWPGAVAVERRNEARRTVARVAAAALAVTLLWRSSPRGLSG
jgi:hypothetical protein